jgi:hypothetical protein
MVAALAVLKSANAQIMTECVVKRKRNLSMKLLLCAKVLVQGYVTPKKSLPRWQKMPAVDTIRSEYGPGLLVLLLGVGTKNASCPF